MTEHTRVPILCARVQKPLAYYSVSSLYFYCKACRQQHAVPWHVLLRAWLDALNMHAAPVIVPCHDEEQAG